MLSALRLIGKILFQLVWQQMKEMQKIFYAISNTKKVKLIKSQKLFISRQNALSYGDDKLLCYVLTDEGLITCEPRDLAPTAHKNKAEIAKAQTLDELQKIERKRGYKRGWAERVYQARLAKRHG
jgi:hypothetical protein